MESRSPLFANALCAVELDHHAAAVLYNAAGFAEPHGQLHILKVERPSQSEDSVLPSSATKVALEAFVHQNLPYKLPYLPTIGCHAATAVLSQGVLAAANQFGATVIILGTHGRGWLLEATLGSVAHDVLKRSNVPVMVVPPLETELVSLEETGAVFHIGRIIVPVDPDHPSPTQLSAAAQLGRLSPDQLLLIHVQRGGNPAGTESLLYDLARRHDLPESTKVMVVKARSVAQGILRAAMEYQAGLIVMGLEVGAKRAKPGMISYEVVRHSRAVVLAVPPQPTEQPS